MDEGRFGVGRVNRRSAGTCLCRATTLGGDGNYRFLFSAWRDDSASAAEGGRPRRLLEGEVMLVRFAIWSNIDGPARVGTRRDERRPREKRSDTLEWQQVSRERTLAEEMASLHAVGRLRVESGSGRDDVGDVLNCKA